MLFAPLVSPIPVISCQSLGLQAKTMPKPNHSPMEKFVFRLEIIENRPYPVRALDDITPKVLRNFNNFLNEARI